MNVQTLALPEHTIWSDNRADHRRRGKEHIAKKSETAKESKGEGLT